MRKNSGLIRFVNDFFDDMQDLPEYLHKNFETEEQKEIYYYYKRRYEFAYILLLFAGFSGMHRLYLRSIWFFAYLFSLTYLWFYNAHFFAKFILYLAVLDIVLIPVVIFIYNLKLKRAILNNQWNAETALKHKDFSIVFFTLLLCITCISQNNSIFTLWQKFLLM